MQIRLQISNNITVLIQYGLIWLFFSCHNTWYYTLNSMIFRAVIIFISIVIYTVYYRRIHEKNLPLLLIFLFVITILDEFIFSGIKQMKIAFYSFMFLIEPLLIGVIAYKYDKERFCDRFVRVILFFAVTSLLFYVLCIVDSSNLIQRGILKKIDIQRLTYTDYYCNFLYAFRNKEVFRNVGVFSEPGLYQIVLNGAIYIIAFYPEKIYLKHKILALGILIITLLTTQSATGILGLIIIFMGILFSKREHMNKYIWNIISALTLFMITYTIYTLILNSTSSTVYKVTIEKIIGISSNNITTGSVRFSTIQFMTNMIVHNPIGYGYSYVANQKELFIPEAVGASIFVTTAAIGIIPVSLLLFYFMKKAYIRRKSQIQFWTLIFLYINTTLAQSREIYPIFVALMLLERSVNVSEVQKKEYSVSDKRKI